MQRTTRSVRLTDAGVRLYASVRPALDEVILPRPQGIHNIQCRRNSAIGLVGFLLGDERLISIAIDDPANGFRKQLEKGVLDDGRKVTKAMVAAMIPEEMIKIREYLGAQFGAGRYDDAARIFADLVDHDTFVEFLTLPAYDLIS